MLLDGLNFRKVSERDNFSFDASFSVNHPTGVGAFGFSGHGQKFNFDFQSGKIIDPEGRYVFSYIPNEEFSISGNVNKGFYDYSINNVPICLSGLKNDFKVQRYFTDTTGCTIDSELLIRGQGFDKLAITGFPNSFKKGEIITGQLVNTGSGTAIDIFSGEFSDSTFTGFFAIQSIPSKISGSQNFVLSGVSGELGVKYDIDFNFDASFGDTVIGTSISGFDYYKYNLFNLSKTFISDFETLPSGTGIITGGFYGIEKTGIFFAGVGSGSGSFILPSGTAHASLDYVSGTTGNLSGMITGINITNQGSGFFDYPKIEIVGGGGAGAQVTGLFKEGLLTGIEVLNAGSGYTSVPDFKVYSGIVLVDILKRGTGYRTAPQLTAVGGGGAGASFSAFIESGGIVDITVDSQGSGYTGIPSINFDTRNVSGLSVSSAGSGYSTGKALFSGGTGVNHTSASADPIWGFRVTGVDILSAGGDFKYPESIYQFFGGGGPVTSSTLEEATVSTKFNWQVTGVYLNPSGLINVGGTKYNGVEVTFSGGTGSNGVSASGNAILRESLSGYSGIDGGEGYKLSRLSYERLPIATVKEPPRSGLWEGFSLRSLMTGYKLSGVNIYSTGAFTVGGGNEPNFVEFFGATGIAANVASGSILTGGLITNDLGGIINYGVTGVQVDYGGFNYTGIPTIKFRKSAGGDLVTNPPLASGLMVSGGVSGVIIEDSGNEKYFYSPLVSFSGGSPIRNASGIMVTKYPYNIYGVPFIGVAMISGGSGYTGIPTVHFTYTSDPPHTVIQKASGTAILGSGFITGIEITNPGNNYQSTPDLEEYASESSARDAPSYFYVGRNFTPPSFAVHTGSGRLIQLNLTSGGSGYTGAPTITVSGDGLHASGSSILATGAIAIVTMAQGIAGVPIIGNYDKTFKNTYNLFTGSGNAESGTIYYNFKENNKLVDSNTKYYSDIVTFGEDESVINIKVINKNYFDDNVMVARLNFSGNGQTTGFLITGAR